MVMKKDQNSTNQNIQDLSKRLGDLRDEADKVSREISKVNEEANGEMDSINSKVNSTIDEVGQIYSELDRIEKDAGDDLDKLMLRQAEDLASE